MTGVQTCALPIYSVAFFTAGGGGYGDVRQRSKEAIAQDMKEGFVSAAKAKELYGV